MKIKTAFLTIGQGAISYSSFQYLTKFTDLRVVVFSRKERKKSCFEKASDYGLWYSVQSAVSSFYNKLTKNYINTERIKKKGIRIVQWKTKQDIEAILEILKQEKISVVVVCGFQHILPASFIESFQYCLNIHPSLLPDYRGPDPIAWGMIEKKKTFGVTIHFMEAGIDTGDILAQKSVNASNFPIYFINEKRIAEEVQSALQEVFVGISENTIYRLKQSEQGFYLPAPTLANRRLRKNGLI